MDDPLDAWLERARQLGFLGPGPIVDHRTHAAAFVGAIGGASVDRCMDLGSGGGVPGLVLARALPESRWLLLDAVRRRTTFLAEAITDLGLADRVQVFNGRAEDIGRDPTFRGTASVVVARGFGPPSVTAECAAPLLRVNGVLVVSEPPGSIGERWPASGLRALGFGNVEVVPGPPAFVRLRSESRVDERFPRRVGVPKKRPLW